MSVYRNSIQLLETLSVMFLLTCVSCTQSNRDRILDRKSIVLIIDSFPADKSFTYLSGGTIIRTDTSILSYMNDDSEVTNIYSHKNGLDTIVISSKREYVEFRYNYTICSRYVLLATGDTVLVRFNSLKEPIFKSLQDERRSILYNFYSSLPCRRFNYGLFAPESAISTPVSIAHTLKKQMSSEQFQQSPISSEYIDSDTLQNAVKDFFSIYNEKMNITDADVDYMNWLRYMSDWYKSLEKESIPILSLSDSYIWYMSFHAFLKRYYSAYCSEHDIPLPTIINDVYQNPLGHRSHRMMFDTLKNDNRLPPKTKLALLGQAVDQMYKEKYPDYEECKQIYLSMGGSNYFDKNDLVIRDIDCSTLKLVDRNKRSLTLETVLKANKGRIIFIDFWSTTCAPCVESMAAAVALRKKFTNKDVAFVYVSTWDVFDTWQKKWQTIIGSEMNYENYLATNYKKSQFIQEFGITAIPRYMIFDRNGMLIDDNAPGPNNPNLYYLISSLLISK